ncbi:MAG: HlyD family efflux transporter periplasmic adaptor subunit [Planctomycetota bacterium]|nr:HlyD family efflux transporter periplasmic adaptor subunit [Planctomycetota bacterium]MDA1214969.1 HlyD family efflux transporter periplasmic adaptor subunit [Planctomycetota bacterium]
MGFASHSLLGQGKSPRPAAVDAAAQPSAGAAGAPPFNSASSNTAPVEQGEAATTLSGERIIVQREAISLIDPRTYRIGFHLEPYRTLEIIAPQDGFIVGVQIKVNDRVESQYELIRFDDRTAKLHLDRAKAAQKIAQVRLKMAESNGDADSRDLAKAELELADAEFEIAKQNFDRAIIRAPFGGEVLDVFVVPGQFVRGGDRLLTIADNSKLKVEVPWERTNEIDIGKTIPLKVEERTVDATIESLKPLADRFAKLRDLANSVTSLMLIVENPARDGKTPYFVGQSVFPPLIPRHVVTEIPTRGVLSDKESGERKVQVLRDLAIRDITVQILGAVGPDRVFISGPFQEKDELILESSVELSDGTQLRPYVGTTHEAEQTVQKKSKSPDRSPDKSVGPRF